MILLQSTGSEFRYGFRKVLGNQNYPTYGLPSTHCILCLNLIKGTFNIVFYTFTHASIHLVINIEFHSKTLTYIYHALILSHPRQEANHGRIKELLESIKNIKNTNIPIQTLISYPSTLNKIISQSNAYTYECMSYVTYLTTSQHLCINA